jgi:hypothetical protein
MGHDGGSILRELLEVLLDGRSRAGGHGSTG